LLFQNSLFFKVHVGTAQVVRLVFSLALIMALFCVGRGATALQPLPVRLPDNTVS
jgi:hypothetical protein